MKRMLAIIVATFVSLALCVGEADAKRFGGGRSSGLQRDSGALKRSPANTAPAGGSQQSNPAAPAPQQPAKNRWLGPIAGLAAGIGLAALLSHFGLGEGMTSVVMLMLLAAAAVFVFRMLTRRPASPAAAVALQHAGAVSGATGDGARSQLAPIGAALGRDAQERQFPAGFDAVAFTREAKLNFLRMQAANDAGDIEDIRAFTTPEMFAEARLQLHDRGAGTQHTDVVELAAEVLDVTEEPARYVVSTRFCGLVREAEGSPAERFDEIWHLVKPRDGSSGWVVAGIQQSLH